MVSKVKRVNEKKMIYLKINNSTQYNLQASLCMHKMPLVYSILLSYLLTPTLPHILAVPVRSSLVFLCKVKVEVTECVIYICRF